MFYHVVAVANNGVIGCKGELPWRLRHDVKWYRQIVGDNTMIMGSKTFEAAKPVFHAGKVIVVSSRKLSLKEALTRTQDEEKVYIMGGESVFQQTIDIVRGIWVARLHLDVEGDAYYLPLPKDMKLKHSHVLDEDPIRGYFKVGVYYYEREWRYA